MHPMLDTNQPTRTAALETPSLTLTDPNQNEASLKTARQESD
jgi:hypothetical protein